jgi:hypothetical protein
VNLNVASQVLDLVRAASSGAEAEVLVDTTELALTRFANSFIHQNVAEATTGVRLSARGRPDRRRHHDHCGQ